MFDDIPSNLPVESSTGKPAQESQKASQTQNNSQSINVSGTKEPEDIFAGIDENKQADKALSEEIYLPANSSTSKIKIIAGILIPVLVLGIGIGSWFIYRSYFGNKEIPELKNNKVAQNTTIPVTPETQQEGTGTPNPIPKPDEDKLAAAQASMALLQAQAAKEAAL